MKKVISNLDAKKAVPIIAYDNPIKFLKLVSSPISNFLSHFCNTCILGSEYADDLKVTQIIPLHESRSKECCSNSYRPTSLLPAVNNVFEKPFYSVFLY